MHKIWKKTMAGALSACLLAGGIPGASEIGEIVHTITVQAETTDITMSGECGPYATWKYNRTTKTLTISGEGIMYDYDEEDDGGDEIVFPWENYKQEIKKLVIGDKITGISASAFASCTGLEQVQFGSGLKSISFGAFKGCSSLKSIKLDGKIEEVGSLAFASCKSLTDVYIGKSLKWAWQDTFKNCDALKKIELHAQNKNIKVQGTTLKIAEISGTCGEKANYKYDEKTKTLTISGTGKMQGGFWDDDYEEYCYSWDHETHRAVIMEEMKKLVIKDGITEIGSKLFEGCEALTTVQLGKNVKKIDSNAFAKCKALKTVNFTNKLEKIDSYAFAECKKLKKLYVGKALKNVNSSAFQNCTGLQKISVHAKNKYFMMKGNSLLNKKKTKWILGYFSKDKTCHISSSVTSFNAAAITEI